LTDVIPESFFSGVKDISVSEGNLCVLKLDNTLNCFGIFLDKRIPLPDRIINLQLTNRKLTNLATSNSALPFYIITLIITLIACICCFVFKKYSSESIFGEDIVLKKEVNLNEIQTINRNF